jgi:MOSC domain-containing protein YiiM
MQKIGEVVATLTGAVSPFAFGEKSAIDKIVQVQRQHIASHGMINDQQADKRFHGGKEKALHIYPIEHYSDWINRIGSSSVLDNIGAFGENISSKGITEHDICLKDKVRIGTTLLEVSQGRMPCWKLNVRFNQKDMAKMLQDTLKTGWYFRVLEDGNIGRGDSIILCERPYPNWSLARIMATVFAGSLNPILLQQLRALPLVESWSKLIENRLKTQQLEDWSPRLIGPTWKPK